jgi:hypothetical protein
MNKIVLALATVATLGLSTAAFAENPTSSIKERAQPVQSHAAVIHKMGVNHRVGAKKYVMAHRHHRHTMHYTYDSGKMSLAKHAAAKTKVKTKASS